MKLSQKITFGALALFVIISSIVMPAAILSKSIILAWMMPLILVVFVLVIIWAHKIERKEKFQENMNAPTLKELNKHQPLSDDFLKEFKIDEKDKVVK